jgi:hypothetical protein
LGDPRRREREVFGLQAAAGIDDDSENTGGIQQAAGACTRQRWRMAVESVLMKGRSVETTFKSMESMKGG